MTTISTFTYIPSPLVADYAFPTPQYPYIPTKSSLSNILHPSEDQPIYSPLDDPVEQEEDHPTINEQRLIEMNEERFVEIYGQDLWAAFRDAQTVVVSDLSSGRRVGERMVQATISLIIATDDDREDSMGDQSSFELLLEILSAPEEDGGEWEMKNYSVTLDDKPPTDTSDSIDQIIHSLRKLHRYIQKYGFSLTLERSHGDRPVEILAIHNDSSNSRDSTLPLTFKRTACDADAPPLLSVGYHQYLLKLSNQKLWDTWNSRREEEQKQEAIKRVKEQKLTMRQMGGELDMKAAELRDNVKRFKTRHEEEQARA